MELQLGKSIRALRTQKGVTQEALAGHLGVSFQAVSKWELGTTAPDIALLPDIAVYFGVDIDALFALPEDARLARIGNLLTGAHDLPPEQFAATEDYLLSLLAHAPDNARAGLLLTRLYLKQAGILRARAVPYAQHALALAPGGKQGLSLYIEAMGGLSGDEYADRHYRLIASLREHIRAHPDAFHAHAHLMRHLLADGRLDEAAALLETMRARWPRHARLRFYEGDIAWQRGDHAAALALWRQGLEGYEGPPALGHFLYAERMERIGRYDEALDAYARDHALSEKPRFVDALAAMAQIQEARGAYAEAIALLEEQILLFQTEWGVVSGEVIDRLRREIERLRRGAQDAQNG